MLLRSCQCALAQRYPDFEVVVADNAGKYVAQEVLASISDPRLKVVRHEKNIGFTGNINACVEHCRHEIVKPMCDDDLLHPDFLHHAAPLVDDDTLVVTDCRKFSLNKLPEHLDEPVPEALDANRRAAGYGKDLWRMPYGSFPTATIFNKTFFKSQGGYDSQSLVSDWDFLVKACLHKNICHLNTPLCYMGVWDQSITEKIQSSQPYYFPAGGLFTKYAVLRNHKLDPLEKVHLTLTLVFDFMLQFIRLIRHCNLKNYRSGYIKYLHEWWSCIHGLERSGQCYSDADALSL